MKDYLEKRNREATDILTAMRKLRDSEIESEGPHAELFTKVVSELSYRIAMVPDEHGLCPNCETPIPKSEYDHYCGFCGQFIRK